MSFDWLRQSILCLFALLLLLLLFTLGELVRLSLQKLIAIGILFKGQSTPKFDQIESFESSFVSQIEEGDSPDIKVITEILKQFDFDATQQDCVLVRDTCAAISTRAARLSVAGIIGLVKKMGRHEGNYGSSRPIES